MIEWGYKEDFERLVDDLAGAALIIMGRHGLSDERIGVILAAKFVCEQLRDESGNR